MRVHVPGCLPPRVADLRPEVVAAARRGACPAGQGLRHILSGFAVDDHVAGLFQVIPVNLYVAAQQHAGAAVAPQAVEAFQLGGRHTVHRGEAFGHGRLCDTVGQDRPAGQGDR